MTSGKDNPKHCDAGATSDVPTDPVAGPPDPPTPREPILLNWLLMTALLLAVFGLGLLMAP